MTMDDADVPGYPDITAATPADVEMWKLLGGYTREGVAFTNDQHRALLRFYGYDPAETDRAIEAARKKHEATEEARRQEKSKRPWETPSPSRAFDAAGVRRFLEEGAARNTHRRVDRDGRRLMALLSRHLQQGEDPVRLVAGLLVEAGYDTGIDLDWIEGTATTEDEEAEQRGANL